MLSRTLRNAAGALVLIACTLLVGPAALAAPTACDAEPIAARADLPDTPDAPTTDNAIFIDPQGVASR